MPADRTVPERQLAVVQDLLSGGQQRSALVAALQLRERYPDALAPLTLAARACLGLGESQQARDMALRATRLRPRNVSARLLYAQALVHSGHAIKAFTLVDQIEDSAANRPGALRRVAHFHRRYGREEDAFRVILKAMERDPGHADSLYQAALLARSLGRMSEAQALCRRLISLDPDHAEGCLLRSVIKPAKPGEHHLEALGYLLEAHPHETRERAALCQALGRELEDLGQHDAAFASYAEAARLRRGDPGESQLLNAEWVVAIENAYKVLAGVSVVESDETPDNQLGATSSRDLFLLGLPCAGFDAFARWLGTQSKVRSIGKVDPLQWHIGVPHVNSSKYQQNIDIKSIKNISETYRKLMLGMDVPRSHWRLHDSPGYFSHVGLLRRVMPGARFIHLNRDPLDQCMALFSAGPGETRLPVESLDKLCEHFTAYHRLMGFARRHFQGAMLEIDYEQFVAEPRRVWVDVSRFLGLEPQDMNLGRDVSKQREDEQVGRARDFGNSLETLARRLRANGVPVS